MLLFIDRMQMILLYFKKMFNSKIFSQFTQESIWKIKIHFQCYFEVYPIADLFRVIFHSCCFILFCLHIVKSNTHGLICLKKLERKNSLQWHAETRSEKGCVCLIVTVLTCGDLSSCSFLVWRHACENSTFTAHGMFPHFWKTT